MPINALKVLRKNQHEWVAINLPHAADMKQLVRLSGT
jgi:hypothetical protein